MTFKADVAPLDDMQKFMKSVRREIADIGQEVIRETEGGVIAELSKQPPRRSYPDDYPLPWTSDDQRQAYFATNGFEAGIPYQRTGGLSKSWRVVGTRSGNAFTIVIENTQDSAKYVFGSLAQDITQASKFQQQFHAMTGWQLASPIVQRYADDVRDLMFIKLRGRLGRVGIGFSRRAFTSGRRR